MYKSQNKNIAANHHARKQRRRQIGGVQQYRSFSEIKKIN